MSATSQVSAPHGGDTRSFQERYGHMPLDFSTCVNPLGTSPRAAEALAAAACGDMSAYPDPQARELATAIAAHEGCHEQAVVCGAGAVDLIYRIARVAAPARALVCAPTFSEYERALAAAGCKVRCHQLRREQGFALDAGVLQAAAAADLVFLCEPNNPTGLASEPALLAELLARCEARGALLVVDECFNGFLADAPERSLRGRLRRHAGLVVIDAFTKLYGLAGVRVGYALCGSGQLAGRLRAAGLPWAVSSLAQAAGVAALEDDAHVARTRAFVARERPRVAAALARLGLQVHPSQANYLLVSHGMPGLGAALGERGVLVRDLEFCPGLGAGYYRIGLRTARDDEVLVRVLEQVLQGEGAA